MQKSYSKMSIVLLVLSILATGLFLLLMRKPVALLSILWMVLGISSVFLPVISKYRRSKSGKSGFLFELLALLIGGFNFYWIFATGTEVNTIAALITYAVIFAAYLILYNKRRDDSDSLLTASGKEMKSTLNIVICAMMAALAIVLSYTTSFYITPTIKVGFSGLPNRLVDYMFGPVVGAIFGGVMDVLKFLIKPDGSFFFGYTLTAMAGGFIYGLFYYKLQIKKPLETDLTGFKLIWAWIKANAKTILLIFIANALVKVICNIGMNTLWTSMMTGKAWLALIPARLIKNLIQIPVDTVLHFVLLKLFCQLKRYILPDSNR